MIVWDEMMCRWIDETSPGHVSASLWRKRMPQPYLHSLCVRSRPLWSPLDYPCPSQNPPSRRRYLRSERVFPANLAARARQLSYRDKWK